MNKQLLSVGFMALWLSACGGGSDGGNSTASSSSPASTGISSVSSSAATSAAFSSSLSSQSSAASVASEASSAVSSEAVASELSSSAQSSLQASSEENSSLAESSLASSEQSTSSETSLASSQASSSTGGMVGINWAPTANAFKVGGSSTDISGSVTSSSGDAASFAITGGKFESAKEAFFYINQTVTGDFSFTANISSWASGTRSGSDQGSIGIMLCESCVNNAASAPASVKIGVRDTGIIHTERLSAAATLAKTSMGNSVVPSNQLFLRISRSGNQVELAYSNNGGADYTLVRTASFIALANSVQIGIYAAQGTSDSNNFAAANISLLADGTLNVSSSAASSHVSSVASSVQTSSQASNQASSQDSAGNSSQSNSSASSIYIPEDIALSEACISLATDANVNWRDTSLQTDQEIVECLYQSLGRPVGYGENAKGGYDPNGNSKLTVITTASAISVEQQILEAITGEAHNWVVFDKVEFAQPYEVAMYRLGCNNATVQSILNASEAECKDYQQWCAKNSVNNTACVSEFFNKAMNKSNNPIRNPVIGSHKTLDGRMSNAYFLFSGFAIGRDSTGTPTQTAQSVILTHLNFRGAGHTEDHYVDPDMIRSTGASSDIWIHKNTFDTTGDSAFDVKVGAHNITMSFNRLVNVKRATLHGSSDSHTIDAQITTSMHHNAFVTTDDSYMLLGNTLRRVPLLRHGKTHMFNNVFVNYRKEILSLRVGANAFLEDNVFVVNTVLKEKSTVAASLTEISNNYFKDIDGGAFRNDRNYLWFGSGTCVLDNSTQTLLTATYGTVADLSENYSTASRTTINTWRFAAGQDLMDYVTLTAGKHGDVPFNSPLSADRFYMEALVPGSCQ